MNDFLSKKARLLSLTGLSLALSGGLMCPAHAQVRGTVGVSLQGTAASSPLLQEDESKAAISVGVRIEPALVFLVDEVTTASLRGAVAVEQYTSNYGTVESFALSSGFEHKLDERTSLNVNASAQSSRSLVRDFLQGTNLPIDGRGALNSDNFEGVNPASPVPGPNISAGLEPALLEALDSSLADAGQGGRINSFSFGASLIRALSPRDSLTLGVFTRFASSDDVNASNFSTASFTGSYRRAVFSRTGFQANSRLERVNYEEGAEGRDGLIFTPTMGIDHSFSESLTGTLELGVSYADIKGFDGSSSKNVSFAGSISVCRRQSFERFCGTASRSARPTLIGGLSNVDSAGITYGRVFSVNDNISLSAQYSRSRASFLGPEQGLDNSQSVVAVSASYSRRLTQRLYAFVTPGYARTSGMAFSNERENYQISTGITYRFGNGI